MRHRERKMHKKDLKTKYYVIKDGAIIGRANTDEAAYKACFILKAARCCIYQHLLQLDDDWFYQLYQDYVGKLPPPPMAIEQMARDVFDALEKKVFPAVRKPSVKKLLRSMYDYKRQYLKEELQLMMGTVKWGCVKVAMSQLRQEGIDIRHHGDGWYVRR